MKFQLFGKTARNHGPVPVSGGDLGKWISPEDPTLGQQPGDVWILDHPVVGLYAPAVYRFRVTFRWIGTHRRVLGTVVRNSYSCYQPELRPDLLVKSITVQPDPNNPQEDDYTAVIANRGATGAGPFNVEMAYGSMGKEQRVRWLRPHATRQLTFVGPLCTTPGPTIVADPEGKVNDYDRSNNSLTATCAATGPSSAGGSGAAPSGSP